MTGHLSAVSKIRVIESANDGLRGILSQLRSTWLGKFYINKIKNIPLLRSIVISIWKYGYPLYAKYMFPYVGNINERRWRTIIKHSDYVLSNGLSIKKIKSAEKVQTPVPEVIPKKEQHCLIPPHNAYTYPEIYITKINNAMIYGGTNLTFAENYIVCHDLYNFKLDYTSEELHGRMVFDRKFARIRWFVYDETPESVPVAATFVDACSQNYAHWISEILPRVALFCNEDSYKDVPIVVNDGLHDNIMESLLAIVGREREIIVLPTDRALSVDILYVTSVAGYVPFERRKHKTKGHSHGMFSPHSFEMLRNKTNLLYQKNAEINWPEKVFLRRNSSVRNISNENEVEKIFVDRGYAIVEPERLTFLQQTQLFKHAKTIVGSSGAAFANLIFADNDAEIIIIISKHPDTSYWYWQNMACASGKTISYALGNICDSESCNIHSNYTVDLEIF